MEVKKVKVFNIEGAIRGMRNPLQSYKSSDTVICGDRVDIGEKDLSLMKKLTVAGKDHRKFLRQIFVSYDVMAPEYWWKQYHTYKVSTTENSTSQMHTLGQRLLNRNDFELEEDFKGFDIILEEINDLICSWQSNKDVVVWRKLIQLMPQSFLYLKTCTTSYEGLIAICLSRKNHKLKEWNLFIESMFQNCPYLKVLVDEIESSKGYRNV